ncbi:hypothetical protein CDAR_237641 [Caerostris darwini]|uniref:Uncharacterized protein n=1 Tax=Caerostris darwini TaxID=1538125 RepID=A0AAV4NGZ8_9ARAC|nr:hypothetical protein CDAR_237641 [Caerostris darwini]
MPKTTETPSAINVASVYIEQISLRVAPGHVFYMKSVHTGTEASFHFLHSTLYEKKRDALPPSRPCLFREEQKALWIPE